ncbi:RAD9 domain-containing protein [Cyclospora cayetanensis]|uniref:RAD9 domain-containing protein n=1 Tax=Cyclospora cayetanensis TaxID=88456 RepID=A0A1D3D4T4_9EIME|nr:RAD9 domain-containing protein [Cyclospora cayetanensis]
MEGPPLGAPELPSESAFEADLTYGQALVLRRCLFALRTVGVELRLSVLGASLHLDAASEAQTAWLHVAFCSSFFRDFRIKTLQHQPRRQEAEAEGQCGEAAHPYCVTLPIKHLWKVLTKVQQYTAIYVPLPSPPLKPSRAGLGPGAGGSRLLRADRIVLAGGEASLRIDLFYSRCGVHSSAVIAASVSEHCLAARVPSFWLPPASAGFSLLSLLTTPAAAASPRLRTLRGSWTFPCRLRWFRRHSLSTFSSSMLRSLEDFLFPFEDLQLSHRLQPDKAVILMGSSGEASDSTTESGGFGSEVVLHQNVFDAMVIARRSSGSRSWEREGQVAGEWRTGPVKGWAGLLWTATSPSVFSTDATAADAAACGAEVSGGADTEEDEASCSAFLAVLRRLRLRQPTAAAAPSDAFPEFTAAGAGAAAEPAHTALTASHGFAALETSVEQSQRGARRISSCAVAESGAAAGRSSQREDWSTEESKEEALNLHDSRAAPVRRETDDVVTALAASVGAYAARVMQPSQAASAAAQTAEQAAERVDDEEAAPPTQRESVEASKSQQHQTLPVQQQETPPLYKVLSKLFARYGFV